MLLAVLALSVTIAFLEVCAYSLHLPFVADETEVPIMSGKISKGESTSSNDFQGSRRSRIFVN